MRTWQPYFFLGSFLLLAFIIFSYLVDINIFQQIDFDTTVRLQGNISRRFDDIFSWFSIIGMFEITTGVLFLILLVKRKIIAGFITFFLFGLFHIIEIFGKTVVENIPPPEFLLRTKRLIEFPQFHVRSEYSYPSGHSGRTVFLSTLIILFIWHTKKLPKYMKIAIIGGVVIFNILMLLSRVYLGEHWATDVIGGSILGAGLGLIGISLYALEKSHKEAEKRTLRNTSQLKGSHL